MDDNGPPNDAAAGVAALIHTVDEKLPLWALVDQIGIGKTSKPLHIGRATSGGSLCGAQREPLDVE